MRTTETDNERLMALLAAEGLPPAYAATVDAVYRPLAMRLAHATRDRRAPLIVGLCGAQGAGKSTVAGVLSHLLSEQGLSVAVLSIDDLYLSRRARDALAERVHPLFKVRGPPGTHDAALGVSVLEALGRPEDVALPRFDKAKDERRPQADWPKVRGPVDVVLFEGWCVGAAPQHPDALADPLNALERDADPDGVWRRHVNAALAADYRPLFDKIDFLILLQAPSFDVVARWRSEQEAKLRARLAASGTDMGATMNPAQIAVFIQHYERLTRHILAEMPNRCDLVLRLDRDRRPVV